MLNAIWLILATGALFVAALGGQEELKAVVDAIFASAKAAVQLVIGLVGVMVFFLGLMRIAFDAGLRDVIARRLTPITRRLFPEIPPDHPAMGAMIMNMASNVLGMGNAATPFGLKAMSELAKLNNHSGSASNAMVLFLAINASAITILPPLGTIGVRAAANSVDPWAIWMPTLFATACSTAAAVTAYILLGRLRVFRHRPEIPGDPNVQSWELPEEDVARPSEGLSPERPWARQARRGTVALGGLLIAGLIVRHFATAAQTDGFVIALRSTLQSWALPSLLVAVLLYGLDRPLSRRDPGGRRHVSRFRGAGCRNRIPRSLDEPAGRTGGSASDGPDPPALGQRCTRRHERNLRSPRPGFVHRPSDEHADGIDRNHFLRPGGLSGRRRRRRRTARALRLPGGRRDGLLRRGRRLPLFLRLGVVTLMDIVTGTVTDVVKQDHATLEDILRSRLGWTATRIESMPAGMGTRRFHRIFLEGDGPATLVARIEAESTNPATLSTEVPIVPDAPGWLSEPALEPLREFLETAGLPVPRSHLHLPEAGIDLLEDVGDQTLGDLTGSRRDDLYREACGIISRLQRLEAEPSVIPAFGRRLDRRLLETKAWKWLHWTIPLLLERPATAAEVEGTDRLFARIADLALAAPQRLSHRDFKAENLHLAPAPREGLVMIDVQGAFLAPPEYDLVCLLYDLQASLDESFVEAAFESTRTTLPDRPDPEQARLRFDALAIARLCKDISHIAYAGRVRGDTRRWREIPRGLELLGRAARRLTPVIPEIGTLISVIEALTPTVQSTDSGIRG